VIQRVYIVKWEVIGKTLFLLYIYLSVNLLWLHIFKPILTFHMIFLEDCWSICEFIGILRRGLIYNIYALIYSCIWSSLLLTSESWRSSLGIVPYNCQSLKLSISIFVISKSIHLFRSLVKNHFHNVRINHFLNRSLFLCQLSIFFSLFSNGFFQPFYFILKRLEQLFWPF